MTGRMRKPVAAVALAGLLGMGGQWAATARAGLARMESWAAEARLIAADAGQNENSAQQAAAKPGAEAQPSPGQEVPIPSTNGSAWVMTLPSANGATGAGGANPPGPGAAPAPPAGSEAAADAAWTANYYPGARQTSAPQYSGEPISVNLRQVDLIDFFRLIHEISGLNIVVDPNVKGTLTIVLDDVPWDQALDIVLRNNGLDKQLQGNVLRIATKETLRNEAEQDNALAKAQTDAAELVTTTRKLSYAKSDDMATTMKKFLTARGSVLSDPRLNTLIIRDVPGVLPVMDALLKQLDKKSQQVEIEARVVAANRSFSRDLGSQLAFAFAAGNSVGGGNSAVGSSPITHTNVPPPLVPSGGTASTGANLPLNTNLGAATPTSGISYIFSSHNLSLDYIISAAESKGIGKLLSKPRVATQNNVKATVKQGVEIPIQTIVNNTISVQYVDAVLEMEVTPQITAEGTVFLDVHVENTQIDTSIPRVEGIPALDTESADTRILINDGGTVVIGGIIISSEETSIDQVPLLGDIPFLGNLFKHQLVQTSSQELLFFLTPRILPG
jgi:type IV pilus assembly protein PilQ